MNNGNAVPDGDLFKRLAAGDEEAFRVFYLRHQGPLYRYALHMTGRKDAAEEVTQEAFMALIREAGRYDPKRGVPTAFLFGIARNHVRRLLETDGRYVNVGEEQDGAFEQALHAGRMGRQDLSDQVARAELTEQVRRAVLSLPEHYREVVTLCDLEEMAYEEAAAMLECPVGTVRSRLNRAREMLCGKLRAAVQAPKVERAFAVRDRAPGLLR